MEKSRKKVSFYTLGCKLNFAETSTIARSFPDDQYEVVKSGTKADIYVINTCTVTGRSDYQARQLIPGLSAPTRGQSLSRRVVMLR